MKDFEGRSSKIRNFCDEGRALKCRPLRDAAAAAQRGNPSVAACGDTSLCTREAFGRGPLGTAALTGRPSVHPVGGDVPIAPGVRSALAPSDEGAVERERD